MGDEARKRRRSGVNVGTGQEEEVRMFVLKVTTFPV